MKELKEAVEVLMREEYERAAESFGESFHSPHEAYAVLKEEVEEAQKEMGYTLGQTEVYWNRIKENRITDGTLEVIEERALNAACECIRVAAMAYKARR